jgi:hypothetical protein
LAEARRLFVRKPTARILLAVFAVVVVLRVALGAWQWRDPVVMGTILGFEPFTEWTIHVFVLHFRPRTVAGHRIDPLVSRKHRAHHADPKDLDLVFIPMKVIWFALVIGIGIPLLVAPRLSVALSAMVASFGMLLTYEWTHFLIHTSYRPKRALYRGLWRAHRWHHYRNERYWFGVTVNVGDRVLRTYPAKDAVPLSDTAQDLNGEGQWTGDDRAVAAHAARGRRA